MKPLIKQKWILILGLLALALLFVLAAGILLALRGFRLPGSAQNVIDTAGAVASGEEVRASSQGEYRNIVFLHHSVGNNLIEQGGVRELFTQAGYSFYDQGYNDWGMRGPDGKDAGFLYPVPNDNTDPDGLLVIFQQEAQAQPVNTLSGLLQHEVIIVKSCYPNSNIGDAAKLQALKEMYLQMRATMQAHPEKLFVVLTTPPLNPAETNAENAQRARAMSAWLTSPEFSGDSANIAVFDFYSLLAEADPAAPDANMLKAGYRDGSDSHPNAAANRAIAPLFVEFVIDAAESFKASQQ